MGKKATECIGATRVDIESSAIAYGVWLGVPEEERNSVVDRMLELGLIKRCSVHPDHYLVKDWRKPEVHGKPV